MIGTLLFHSVHPLFCWEEVEPPSKFSERRGGLDRTSIFRGGVAVKKGMTFFPGGTGGCCFNIKSKLKSEIFNNKKVYKEKKRFFLS